MRKVVAAATQMACSADQAENLQQAEKMIRQAADRGANIVLLQELYETQYFAQMFHFDFLNLAKPIEDHETLQKMSALAKELNVVLPISFYELAGTCRFNSVMVIDADGRYLGKYRKTHIPDDPGYYEKFYFSPGDTGFQVWDTSYGKIGIGICWDQWFPEAARIMALKRAEMLLYPTAIGTSAVSPEEVQQQPLDYAPWQNAMIGHAAVNMMPVIASNRIGIEAMGGTAIKFWGRSFIADHRGNIVCQGNVEDTDVLLAEFDLDEIAAYRREMCLFRDRRPEKYGTLFTLDGQNQSI